MQPKTLPEVIQHLAKQQQEKLAAELSDAQHKLITVTYDRAASYTTVIIFGGYAGFFAIWQLSKEYLTKGQALWSALLVLISLFTFVLFEVFKMIMVSRNIFKRAAILNLPEVQGDPHRMLKELQGLDAAQQVGLKGFMVAWAITVAIAVGGAVAGAAILAYAFITGLAA